MPADARERSSRWAVILAAGAPFLALPLAPLFLAAEVGGSADLVRRVAFGPVFFSLIGAALLISVLVSSVCLGLLARGARLPAVLPAAVAALPWLAGNASLMNDAAEVLATMASTHPGDRPTLLAAGLSAASVTRLTGALFSAVLMMLVGAGLAIAARARARSPSSLGALIGALAAAPLVAAAWLVPFPVQLAMLAAAAGAFSLVVAARSAGAEVPHARSAALAAAAGAPIGIAVIGSAVAALVARSASVADALAMSSPADRLTLAIAMSGELRKLDVLATWGWALAVAPVLGVGGWAVMRGSAVRAPLGELIASVLLVAGIAGADLWAARAMNRTAASISSVPWQGRAWFRPVPVAGRPFGGKVDAVLGPGEPWLPSEAPDELLVVALDARVTAAELAQLISACQVHGVKRLMLVGQPLRARERDPSSEYDALAWLVQLLDTPTYVELQLSVDGSEREVGVIDLRGLNPEQLAAKAFSVEQAGAVPVVR